MGLAIASANAKMAQPHGTLERINRNEDMRRLRELTREHRVKRIVVGLPLNLDGTRGEMAEEAERFAQRVRKQLGVLVEMVDERLTSWEALARGNAGKISPWPPKGRRQAAEKTEGKSHRGWRSRRRDPQRISRAPGTTGGTALKFECEG
jgi:putative transcription antitermination factor YqgF